MRNFGNTTGYTECNTDMLVIWAQVFLPLKANLFSKGIVFVRIDTALMDLDVLQHIMQILQFSNSSLNSSHCSNCSCLHELAKLQDFPCHPQTHWSYTCFPDKCQEALDTVVSQVPEKFDGGVISLWISIQSAVIEFEFLLPRHVWLQHIQTLWHASISKRAHQHKSVPGIFTEEFLNAVVDVPLAI